MRTPQFWLNNNLISKALLPLSLFYKIGFELRKFLVKKHHTTLPIICIGNIIAGGAGKTPLALAMGKYFKRQNIKFCYLTRGYKSQNNGVKFIDNNTNHSSCEVGDEGLLLAEIAETYIAKDRFLAYQQIVDSAKYQLIIMDDGLQNYQLNYAYKILVIDGKIGFGNEKLIPSGPMRQSLASIVKNIDLFVIIGNDLNNLSSKIKALNNDAKIVNSHIICRNINKFTNQKILAFCGIGYPQKFFDYCRNLGLNIVTTQAFADHHHYKDFELNNLLKQAHQTNGKLLTTKKDWVKFTPHFQNQIDYLDIELKLDEDEIFNQILQKIIT